MLKKVLLVGPLPLILSACIGSQFVVDDTNNEAPFPDLHHVPERPVFEKRSTETVTKEQMSKIHQEELRENERLRQKHGL